MRKDELKRLGVAQLNALKAEIQKELARRKRQDTKEEKLLARFRKMAEKEGISLDRLLAAKTTKKTPVKKTRRGGKVAPKYRNPANKSETWSGRGRKPAWVRAILDQGGKLEDIAIQ